MPGSNIAIIIAVSEYEHVAKLPACHNDGVLIRDIVQATERFAPEHVFFAGQNTDSSALKTNLSKFIKGISEQRITVPEVFFYYSGHGVCDGAEFYYLLSDYTEERINQTTLSNTELDGMLRTLSPDLAVKIVDACHSGTHYVKSSDDIEKTLRRSTEGQFKRCYFMFSSEQHQPSWQDDRLSYFTRAIARALAENRAVQIRYKDIIAYVSDQFATNSRQKPIFITQAGFTEIFAEPLAGLTRLLDSKASLLLEKDPNSSDASANATAQTTTTTPMPVPSTSERLKQRIVDEAGKFCTENEANAVFGELRKAVETCTFPELLAEFFEIGATFLKDTYSVPASIQIAKWLEQNKNEYFVDLKYEQERYEPDDFEYAALFRMGRRTTAYRSVLKDFDSTVKNPPYRCVHITATPRYLNLPKWVCYIALVNSRVECRGFFAFAKFIDENWSERRRTGQIEWKTTVFPLKGKDIVQKFFRDIAAEFVAIIEKDLFDKYEVPRT